MESNKQRISWDDYFKEICEITAKRSCCKRLNVGCVLVKEKRIISQGYNGFLPGFPHESIIKDVMKLLQSTQNKIYCRLC